MPVAIPPAYVIQGLLSDLGCSRLNSNRFDQFAQPWRNDGISAEVICEVKNQGRVVLCGPFGEDRVEILKRLVTSS